MTAEPVTYTRREVLPLGHLVLDLRLSDAGGLHWALRAEDGARSLVSGVEGAGDEFASQIATAAEVARLMMIAEGST